MRYEEARQHSRKIYYEIIKSIAEEENISTERVDLVIRNIFQNLVNQMREGNPAGCHIVNFGTWTMKKKQEEAYEHYVKGKG